MQGKKFMKNLCSNTLLIMFQGNKWQVPQCIAQLKHQMETFTGSLRGEFTGHQ